MRTGWLPVATSAISDQTNITESQVRVGQYNTGNFQILVYDNTGEDNDDDEDNTDENFQPRSLSSLSSCSDGDEDAFRSNGTVYPAGITH